MRRPKISVLYEDSDVLVINKPAGLIVHPDGRTEEPSVVDWILAHHPEMKEVGDYSEMEGGKHKKAKAKKSSVPYFRADISPANLRPGIIHRLDRETSGALLLCKSQKAFWHFKKQFQRQKVHKEYHAFVYGLVKNNQGLIDRPIARSRANPILWSATRGKRGQEREAVTEYEVRRRGLVNTFLALFPRTGRTHQIRVHLKAINYPIVCDRLYASGRPCELGFNRLALHAYSLMFVLPDGTQKKIEAPYPPDFEKALTLLGDNA